MTYRYEWDQAKNLSNQRKHGISFEEAARVFLDLLNILFRDTSTNDEERWRTFGYVDTALLVMVVHTLCEESSGQEVIRIISARRATARERRHYER